MNRWKVIVIMFLVLLAIVAMKPASAETWLEINLASHHHGFHSDEVKLNRQNYGIGMMWDVSDNLSVKTGNFTNSYSRESQYFGVDWHIKTNEYLSSGVMLGVATGYDDTPEKTVKGLKVMLIPNIAIGKGKFKVIIGHVPTALGLRYALTTLQFRVDISQ